ncbi:MAG: DUF924 family protein [Pseudomonadota bacterium]
MWQDINQFWFQEIKSEQWWRVDPKLDESIRQRFAQLIDQAIAGELYQWRDIAQGRLAEIILLDQFSRNIHRNSAQAFEQDKVALVLAQEAVTNGILEQLAPIENAFLLMPYMHSESSIIHIQAEYLYKNHTPENNYKFEMKHKKIIDQFGRYPHRNAILGRQSTEAEIEFLQQPDSSF